MSNNDIHIERDFYQQIINLSMFLAFRGSRKEYLSNIEKNYKTWKDVYDTDNNVPYIASDSWTPDCPKGNFFCYNS